MTNAKRLLLSVCLLHVLVMLAVLKDAMAEDAGTNLNDLLVRGFSIVGTENVDPVRTAFFLQNKAEVWSCIVARLDTPGAGLFYQAATGCHPIKGRTDADQIAKAYNFSNAAGRISRVAPTQLNAIIQLALVNTQDAWIVTLNLNEPDAPPASVMSASLTKSEAAFQPRRAHVACVGDEPFLAIKYKPDPAADAVSEVAVARAHYQDLKLGEFVMRAFDRLGLLVLSDREQIHDLMSKAKGGAPVIQLEVLGSTLKGSLEISTKRLWQAEAAMQTKCLQPIEVK